MAALVVISDQEQALIKSNIQDIRAGTGQLTPEALLEKATPVESPLHRFFDWDNDHAAHEHRLQQARYIIRYVVYRTVRVATKPREMTLTIRRSPPPALPPIEVPCAAPPASEDSDEIELRERFIKELSETFRAAPGGRTLEDLLRACWDDGYLQATLLRKAK